MKRFQIIIFLSAILLTTGLFSEFLGFSLQCLGDDCIVAASSNIPNIFIAISIIFFITLYPQHTIKAIEISDFNTLHKIMAFLTDFMVVMLILTPFAGFPLLMLEFNYTGSFEWAFQRDYLRSTDTICAFLNLLFALSIMAYYFYKHKKSNRLTIGQYLLSGIK